MSSSSAISRVTRSASASTVSSISRFWSSVNRSHLASRVAVKPFTEVSGERSSWATVAISSAWLRSVRRRASVSRRETTTRRTGPLGAVADVPGGDEHLAAAGQQQVALGLADPGGEASVGVGQLPPAAAFQVLQGQCVLQGCAEGVGGADGGDAGGGGVEADRRAPLSSATTRPSGSSSGSTANAPPPAVRPSAARRGRGASRACVGLLAPTLIPAIPPLFRRGNASPLTGARPSAAGLLEDRAPNWSPY